MGYSGYLRLIIARLKKETALIFNAAFPIKEKIVGSAVSGIKGQQSNPYEQKYV